MSLAKNLGKYEDVRAVFDAALKSGFPSRYALPTANAAVRWRSRAYYFRSKTEVEDYQSLIFRIEPDHPSVVILDQEEMGTLFGPDGKTVEVKQAESELENEAARLRKELGL